MVLPYEPVPKIQGVVPEPIFFVVNFKLVDSIYELEQITYYDRFFEK